MKLLFDQNISHRLVRKVISYFPNSEQVRRLGYENKTDWSLWNFAKQTGFTIVTYDSDFDQLSRMFGHPPKLLWIKMKDQTTRNIERLIISNISQIQAFDEEDRSCLELIG